jgi:hypothetical protein
VHPFWLSHEEKQTWLKHSIGGGGGEAGHGELAGKGREERSRGRALLHGEEEEAPWGEAA